MKQFVLASACISLFALSAFAYNGPKNPGIPADSAPIRLKIEECAKDAGEVMGGDPLDPNDEMTKNLCAARKQHFDARNRLLADLARLVKTFDGMTNHDHDQNLPKTIQGVQSTVANCKKTLESQQYPHNIGLVMVEEDNAIFCDNSASELTEQIIGK